MIDTTSNLNGDSTGSIDIPLCSESSLRYFPQFISSDTATLLLNRWIDEIPWEQSEISLFGKRVKIPRKNAWYGDRPYSYSGTRFEATPMNKDLNSLKLCIEEISGLAFNSVLVNWYRNGQDCMGWHSDDEKSLGPQPQIASVSLGDTRRFVLRQKCDKTNKHTVELSHGSLILMLGKTQALWQHALPRTTKSEGSRINLTFRYVE